MFSHKSKLIGCKRIRLSLSYRAIYSEQNDGVEFVRIEEVNKHEY